MSRSLGRSAVVTADQVCSSASNSLVLIAVAQTAAPDEFASLATLFVLVTAALGFNRASLGTPLLLLSARAVGEIRVETQYAVNWAMVTSIPVTAAVAIGAFWLDVPVPGLLLAAGVGLVLVQDVLRISSIAVDHSLLSLASDFVWMMFTVAVVIAGLVGVGVGATTVLLVWLIGAVVAVAIVGVPSRLRVRRRLGAWWATYWRHRLRLGIVGSIDQVSVLMVVAAVAVTVDADGVAAIRGASTLFGPLAMLLSAVPLLFIPHVRRSGLPARSQWRLLGRGAVPASVIAAVFGVVAAVLPVSWGALLFGDSWGHIRGIVAIIGVEYAAIVWIACSYSLLQSQGRSAAVLRVKRWQVVVQVVSCAAAGAIVGSVAAVAWALAATAIVVAVWSAYVARDESALPGRNHDPADPASVAATQTKEVV
ncbi:MAG: hypothetical protein QM662_00300 [Gordonia sp. (in: high G+C Gram-positive bacteria)]